MANKGKEVAVQQQMGFLATQEGDNLPAHLQNDGPARGNEAVTSDDLQIPRLKLIQQMTPERNKRNDKYIEGAEEGMMFNTVDRSLMTEVYVVSLLYVKKWNVWYTRDAAQDGLVASCFTESMARQELSARANEDGIDVNDQKKMEETYELIETPEQVCLQINPETGELSPLIVDMPSTKQKVCKNWNSVAQKKAGDRFSHAWKITSVGEQNKAGEDFSNYKVDYLGPITQEMYETCLEEYGHQLTAMNVQRRSEGLDELGGAPVSAE